jgi:acyl-CoA thioesterase FadM
MMREEPAFECRFEVRWSDLDGNRHVRNTAFSEYATHTRFRLLAAHGFDQARLQALRFGPVMMREAIRYNGSSAAENRGNLMQGMRLPLFLAHLVPM